MHSFHWMSASHAEGFLRIDQYVLPFRSHMAVNRRLRQFNQNSSPGLKRSARKEAGYKHLRFLHFPADRSAFRLSLRWQKKTPNRPNRLCFREPQIGVGPAVRPVVPVTTYEKRSMARGLRFTFKKLNFGV
eukprot:s3000_g15.t1